MTRWRQHVLDVLFITAEAIAWYMALRVIATAMEKSFLSDITERLQSAIATRQVADLDRAGRAIDVVRSAMSVEHGPPLWILLAVGLGAFGLMRALMRYRFEGPLGAALFIAGTVLGLNVLMHIALGGDLRVWDPSGLANFAANPDSAFAGRLDLNTFIRRPSISRPHGAALTAMFVAMLGMWLRFALAGRSRVTFERVLRSFTVSFVVVLVTILFARGMGLERLTIYAVPQFALGMLALAVANHARAIVPEDGAVQRTGPWMLAVGGTVLLLTGIAMLLGLLALLNVGAVLDVIGTVAVTVISFVLIVVMTPVFWVLEKILRLFIPQTLDRILANLGNLRPLEPPPGQEEGRGPSIPDWIENGVKFLAVVAIVWLAYRGALLIMARRRALLASVDEVRGQASSGAGLGELLRGLLPRAVRGVAADWTRRQAIYRLYRRAVVAGDARGFRYLPGETPLEYSARASRMMDAPPYAPIGAAFDAARYGRHYPADDEVRAMDAAFGAWEAATPPTRELRERLAGREPLTKAEEFELLVAERRRERRHDPPPAPPPQML